MKRSLLFLALLAGLPPSFLLLPAPMAAEQNVKVLSPPDQALLGGKQVHLVLEIKKPAPDAIRVTVNREPSLLIRDFAGKNRVPHQHLALAPGKNQIRIEAMQGVRTLEETTLTLFRKSALASQFDPVPPGFSEYLFHVDRNEAPCSRCHQKELGESGQVRCLRCHQNMGSFKFAHGPVSVGECARCHSLQEGGRKYGVPVAAGKVCRTCHTEEMAQWAALPFGHGPALAGQCTLCHDPHGSDRPSLLVRSSGELCLSCHREELAKPHVPGVKSLKGHPVLPDQSSGGKLEPVSCPSCHNPHAADNQDLLKNFQGSLQKFCRTCHQQ